MKKLLFLFTLLLTINFGLTAQTGLEIANLYDEADNGFESSTSDVRMILRNASGEESQRKIVNQVLEGQDGEDKALIKYFEPDELSGTATVVHSKVNNPDKQWIYLPSTGRVTLVDAETKSGPFLGSEFAYEDIYEQPVNNYNYKYIRKESSGQNTVHVVRRVPNYEYSGYSFQLVWFNESQGYRIEKIEYYDSSGDLKKTLSYLNYSLYLEKHWRAKNLIMRNYQNEKETELIFTNYKFKIGLTHEDFSPEALAQ